MAQATQACLATASGEQEAGDIARAVLGERLAACVQLVPVASHFWWEGRMQSGAEVLMVFKAREADYPALEAAIRARHSYDVPEILKLPVAGGSRDHLSWLFRETERG